MELGIGVFITVVVLYGLNEMARMAVFYKRMHHPIRRHVRKWKRFNKSASSLVNPNLSLYRYAYNQLSIEQLKHVRLSMDSVTATSWLGIFIHVIAALVLPFAAFLYGLLTALSSNTANLTITPADLAWGQLGGTILRLAVEAPDLLTFPLAIMGSTVIITAFIFLTSRTMRTSVATKLAALLDQMIAEGVSHKNLFKTGTPLIEEEDFRSAVFFQIPVCVLDDEKPVLRGVIRKTSFVSVTIERQSFEKQAHRFMVI